MKDIVGEFRYIAEVKGNQEEAKAYLSQQKQGNI
jgi:hypothetical protein